MREIRLSGSEGGAGLSPRFYLCLAPTVCVLMHRKAGRERIVDPRFAGREPETQPNTACRP
jgi:hypothetical protein